MSAPLRILDVGCHDGYITHWLRERLPDASLEVCGMELNEEAARRARERGVDCRVGHAEEAARYFNAGSFDIVVGYEIIEHVPDVQRFLGALEAMAKPGGAIYLSTPDGTFGEGNNPHHLRTYRSIDLADLCRRRGTLLDAEVGQDGICTVAYTPCEKFGDIAIYTGPGWETWSPHDIEMRGLGGSETAAVRLAEELAELGWIVTIYGSVEQGAYRDVVLRDWQTFDPTERRAALIASRMPEVFDRLVCADTTALWVHDVDVQDRLTRTRAERIDHIFALSRWHAGHLRGAYPFAAGKVTQIRNGIKRDYFTNNRPWSERAQRALYTSSPDRGLDVLLELWPRVRAEVPDAELFHCYAEVYDKIAAADPAVAAHRERIRELSDQAGVVAIGAQTQPQLARLMGETRVWAHPSWASQHGVEFHETSCLSGDTLIDMPRDHRKHPMGVPIAELEGESGFPVWAWSETEHRFTLATAKRCWKSRVNVQTITVEFEEGTEITCTPEHKVLTFDGDWVEAGTLCPGDRLRGLNYRYQVNVNLGDGRWTGEHRMVGEWMEGRKLGRNEHVHHLGDPTRLDNRPESLEVLSASEHHSRTHAGRKYPRAWKERRRQLSLAWKDTPEGREHYRRNASTAGKNLWGWVRSLPDDERKTWLAARAAKAAQSRRENMGEEAYRDSLREVGAQGSNHRVKSIRTGPVVDVYDMEVEEHHNFVAGGVVVHNCIGAMEAQAAGAHVVASGWGALPETVRVGSLVNSVPMGEKWRSAFVREIVRGLTDEVVGKRATTEGPKAVADLGWDGVAKQVAALVKAGWVR